MSLSKKTEAVTRWRDQAEHRIVPTHAKVAELVEGLPSGAFRRAAQPVDHFARWVRLADRRRGRRLGCATEQRAASRAHDRHHAVVPPVLE